MELNERGKAGNGQYYVVMEATSRVWNLVYVQ